MTPRQRTSGDERRAAAGKRPPARSRAEPRRRAGKLTIAQALDGSAEDRQRSLAAVRRAREKEKQRLSQHAAQQREVRRSIREVIIPEAITVQELANRMAERAADVIKALMRNGVMANINQVLDADTAELVVTEFGHRLRRVTEADVEQGLEISTATDSGGVPRAAVVTIMGHVDHGKTSLLDALCARPTLSRVRRAASPSISAPIR